MSRRTVREVGKSRELLWLLLDGKKCCFCKKPFLYKPWRPIRFGNATAPALDLNITLHHKDGDHSNNGDFGDRKNILLSHDTCHRTHHAQEIFRSWRDEVKP